MPEPRTLALTSPHLMRDGQDRAHPHDVSAAQRLLHAHVAVGRRCYTGPIDGEFGPHTAQACARAKLSYGYRRGNAHATFGRTLRALLTEQAHPTPAMRARGLAWAALERRRIARHRTLAAAIIGEATKHLGYHENADGSSTFGQWYGFGGPNTPWCAMFATYCGVHAGSKAFQRGSRWSYVPTIHADAQAGRYGLRLTGQPVPGDLVLFDWSGTRKGPGDHVGIVAAVPTAASVESVDGNRSDQVERASTGREFVLAFVHVTE